MNVIIDYIRNNFGSIITSGATSAAVVLIYQTFVKQSIKGIYDKKLAKFKADLDTHAETRKFDFERMIHDFTLYSAKRHELYPELYKKVYSIKEKILTLEVNSTLPEEIISSNVIPYYEAQEISLSPNTKHSIYRLLGNWDRSKEESAREISSIVAKELKIKLSKEIDEAEGFFKNNTLFFSEEINVVLKELFHGFNLFVNDELRAHLSIPDIDEQKISNEFDKLASELKNELRIGDYK